MKIDIIKISDNIITMTCKILATLSGIIMISMMFVIVYGVVMRYFLRQPAAFTIEFSELGLFATSCLAWAYVQHLRKHVRMDIVITHLSGRTMEIMEALSSLLLLVYAAILVWVGFILVLDSQTQNLHSLVMHMPIYLVQSLLIIGALAMACKIVIQLAEIIRESLPK